MDAECCLDGGGARCSRERGAILPVLVSESLQDFFSDVLKCEVWLRNIELDQTGG